MEFGLFMEFYQRPGYSQAQAFEESFARVRVAEEAGLDSIWLAEIHFAPDRSVLASPLTVASAIAAQTKRIRIGTAVEVLPLGNPIRMAEEAATVDHISKGRFEFGVGRSGLPRGYIGYNIPYSESRARFFESLEVIQKAWTMEHFSHKGQFYSYNDVCVVPKPYQSPHPPIRVAANSSDTFHLVGRMGFSIFVGVRGGTAALKERIQSYKAAWKEAGHQTEADVSLRVPVYVAETQERAFSDPKDSTMNFYRRFSPQLGEPLPGLSPEANQERAARAQRMKNVTYDEVFQNDVAYGTPEVVIDRIQHLKEEFELNGIVAEMNQGGLVPHDRIVNSIRLFADKVMPKLK